MKELNNNRGKLKEIYKEYAHSFVFDSIIEGFTLAQIYVDDLKDISIFIICEGHCVYFGGESQESDKYKEAINFFKEKWLTEEKRKDLGIIKINYYTDIWEKELIEGLKELPYNLYDRSLFKQELRDIPMVKTKDNIAVKRIDKELFKSGYLENLNCVLDEVTGMWGSVNNFIKNGFGYCAVIGETIVSWCTAEYVSEKYCGIGIETIEEQEGKGVATIVSNAFLKKCLALNIIPYWDSWKKNLPSVRVAEKNNFLKVCDYRVIFIEF